MLWRVNKKSVQREEKPTEAIFPDLFSFLAKNLAIFAAFLYAAGWIYLRSYYAFFDIDISQLDLSWNDILVHSIVAGRYIAPTLLGYLLLLLMSAACLVYFRKRIFNVAGIPPWTVGTSLSAHAALLVGGVAMFAVTMSSARQVGREQAIKAWKAPRQEIVFSFKENCVPDAGLKKLNDEFRLRMLKSTGKYYFLFARTGESSKDKIMQMRWFKIPIECVHYAQGTIRRSLGGRPAR